VTQLNCAAHRRAIEVIRAKSTGRACVHSHDVTINFHPDRLTADGSPLLLAIAGDDQIQSQFETGTSNGGLTAHLGGDRWLWEQRIFAGAYDNSAQELRPKYGAVNFNGLKTGAAPRFGSAFFCLKPHVLERSTFCYPDSVFEPESFATEEFLGALIELATQDNRDILDSYIEAQIHGFVSLAADVQYLALDPVYRSTEIEEHAQALSVPIRWHEGYELSIEQMSYHPNYRGTRYINIAKELAVDGKLDALILGAAVNSGAYAVQDIKKLWQYLARFGFKGKT